MSLCLIFTGAHKGKERSLGPWKLELQAVIRPMYDVDVEEPGSSPR